MNKCILLVEDTEDLRANITEALIMEGYSVLQARNGAEGLEQLTRSIPDAIITDLLMPEMDGFNFIKEVRRMPQLDRVNILVYSAMPAQENEKKVMALGANLYLKKPGTLDALIEAVAKLTT